MNQTSAVIVSSGTRQSGDVLVRVAPHSRTVIKVSSPVAELVGASLRELTAVFLEQAGIAGVSVEVCDNAASEWVVRARLRTAVRRWLAAEAGSVEKVRMI